MKKSLLFILTGAALLMASCNNPATPAESSKGPAETSQGQSSAQSQSEESSSRSSRTRTTSSSEEAKEAELPETLPEIEGTNVVYLDNLASGGEADAAGNPGSLYCWNGDGGVKYSFGIVKDEVVLEYGIGWAWYGVQLFYQPVYAKGGDVYTMRLRMHSDAAGQITINGQVTDLVWGWNVVTMDVTTPAQAGKTTVSIQLGVNGGDAFTGTTLRMKELELYDKVNTYHTVTFKDGEDELKNIKVRAGELVAAPSVDTPEGMIFVGWYDGENVYEEDEAVTKEANYVAKFVDAATAKTHKVTYKLGEHVVAEQDVVEGTKAQTGTVAAPYGYVVEGWYSDATLNTRYNFRITEDTILYAKAKIAPVYYIHDGQCYHETGYGENGETIESFKNHGFDAGWNIQVNFGSFPVGEANKRYSFTAEYKLDGTNDDGSFQIYDEATVQIEGSNGTLSHDGQWHTISFVYDGQSFLESAKLTFELGLVHPSGEGDDAMFNFSLRNVWHGLAA